MATFSSELQRLENKAGNEFSGSEFIHMHKTQSGIQNSINFKSTRRLSEECADRFNLSDESINQHYEFGEIIGNGKYGQVFLGHSLDEPDFLVAIKVIKIRKIKSNFESVMKEIEMLKSASHPDIVKIINIYNDPKKLYIVMEYVKGEELYDYIVSKDNLLEEEAKIIISQLLRIVKYLNSINICHRDLKPENIMIDTKTLKIKLLDFGLSSYFSNQSLVSPVGTPYYVSPEVLKGQYNKECDMWSVGVITYILLTGTPPFQGDSLPDIYREIMRFNIEFDEDEWNNFSIDAREFVECLIEPDIRIRMTPDQALEHSWLSNFECTKTYPLRLMNPQKDSQFDIDEYKIRLVQILKEFVCEGKIITCNKCILAISIKKLKVLSNYDVIGLKPDCIC